MDYLDRCSCSTEGEYTIILYEGGDHNYLPSWTAVYSKENGFSKTGQINKDSALGQMHDELVEDCREKAKQKLADIELANRSLFWCMYED